MKRGQIAVVIVLIVLSWVAFFSLLTLTAKKVEPLPSSSAPVEFDTKSAMGYIEALSGGFPYRSEGSAAYIEEAAWLANTFRGWGSMSVSRSSW
jgi:hypothetical protein